MTKALVIDGDVKKAFLKGQADPVFWSREVVGDSLYDKQEEVLCSVRDHAFTSVAAANGVGKTFIASRAAGWFLTSIPGSRVVTTAPTGRQVKALLWAEIARMNSVAKHPLGGRLLTQDWIIAPGWYATGFATDDPNKFQGFHSPSILVIADEAAGIPENIYLHGIDSLLTSHKAKLLMIGNPTEPTGRFRDSHEGASKRLYNAIRISAFDTPNLREGRIVSPYLVTPTWVDQRRIIWGEDSTAYQSRVLAKFPQGGTNSLIPASWVDKSFEIEDDEIEAAVFKARVAVIGVDPAREGDDSSPVAVRRGQVVTRLETFHHLDTYKLAKEVCRIADSENIGTPSGGGSMESCFVCDTVGVGAGVVDNLRNWNYNVLPFNSSNRAFLPDRYANRRAEVWWHMRELFQMGPEKGIMIPRYNPATGKGFHRDYLLDKLRGQFSGINYEFDNKDRYLIEDKKKMKKRLSSSKDASRGDGKGNSPDEAEAILHAFAFDSMAETVVIDDAYASVVDASAVMDRAAATPGTVAYIMRDIKRESELEREYGWLDP